jgi:hypothetical protein
MNDDQVKAAVWLFSEMKKNPRDPHNPDYMLEKDYGISEGEAEVIVMIMEHIGIFKKHGAGHMLEPKFLSINDLEKYIKNEDLKERGELSAAKKSDFDWRNRWWAHPLVTAVSGFIFGLLTAFITFYVIG